MFSNDEPEDRRALIAALRERDVPAYEYHSGGGLFHVVADVVDDPDTGDLLQIATGSANTACDLGLMGWRNGESWEAAEWSWASTLGEATACFAYWWDERGRLAVMFKQNASNALAAAQLAGALRAFDL